MSVYAMPIILCLCMSLSLSVYAIYSGGIGQQALSPSASLAPLPFVGDNNNATKKLLRFKFALPKSPITNMV